MCLQGYFLNCLNFKLTFYLNNMLESCGFLVPITSFEKNGKERLQNKELMNMSVIEPDCRVLFHNRETS